MYLWAHGPLVTKQGAPQCMVVTMAAREVEPCRSRDNTVVQTPRPLHCMLVILPFGVSVPIYDNRVYMLKSELYMYPKEHPQEAMKQDGIKASQKTADGKEHAQ